MTTAEYERVGRKHEEEGCWEADEIIHIVMQCTIPGEEEPPKH